MTLSATTDSANAGSPSLKETLSHWWQRLAFHHRGAESTLHLLFITGFPLWSLFALPWPLERSLLLIHSLAGLLLFPLYVLPFWLSHRRLLQRSRKALLRKTGQWLEILLLLCGVSGFYLIFIGNRGDLPGAVAHYLHLVTAIPLALLLIYHALRWSVLSWLIRPLQRLAPLSIPTTKKS